jgi:ABC-2 type transport system permease protein
MSGAFTFFFSRTVINQFRYRMNRLRQPRYLVSAIVGLGYLYFFLFRRSFGGHRRHGVAPIPLDSGMVPLLETLVAFALFVMVLWPWISPASGGGLSFSEAEVQFLFPAPLGRKQLLLLRILRAQKGILFGVLVSALLGRFDLMPHPVFVVIALWLVYTFLSLYRMAANLAKTSLTEHGVAGFRRQACALALMCAAVVATLSWFKWYVPGSRPPTSPSPEEMIAWLTAVTQSGPLHYVLLPFRLLIGPAFASTVAGFARALVPSFAIVWLVYLWVIRSDAQFEEASVERAERTARKLESMKAGDYEALRARPARLRVPYFRLSPVGRPYVAVFWKNLISTGRLGPRRLLIIAGAIFVAVISASRGGAGGGLPILIGGVSAGMMCFLTLLGPAIVRQDFRDDLLKIELIKTYPVSGWEISLGEILAPAVVLAALEWLLLAVSAIALPQIGPWDRGGWARVAVALGAALLLPCISLAGVVIQNAVALLLPGWVQLGPSRQRGVEAMGQRLISMVATIIVLVFAAIPAAVIFLLGFFIAYWMIGIAAVPPAALAAATCLLVETGIATALLGRLYDRFDASLDSLNQ